MFVLPTFGFGVVASPSRVDFDNTLTFPTIQVFSAEAEFINRTDAPQYTIVHAKDTDKLYVWDGSAWYIYDNTFNFHSLSFDGTNQSMDVSSTSDFAFGSSGFSISFWFNGGGFNSPSGFGVNVFDMRSSPVGSQPSLWIETGGAGSLVKYYAAGGYKVSTTATLNSGTWYHLVITNDGSTTKIYLDGNTTPIGTGSDSTTYVSAPLRVGGYHNNNYYYDGLIDEFAIFNYELSASDVSAIYNNGVPNNISSLNPLGWWRMGDLDGGTGTITDQGSGGNNGTSNNGPTLSTNVPS